MQNEDQHGGSCVDERNDHRHRAAMDASKAGAPRQQQTSDYEAAVVELQDEYYQEVGARHSLTGLGLRRQHLSRKA